MPRELRLIAWVLSLGPNASWSDISAWSNAKSVKLCGWEAEMLRELSLDYNNFLHEEKLRSPYSTEADSEGEMKAFFDMVKASYG